MAVRLGDGNMTISLSPPSKEGVRGVAARESLGEYTFTNLDPALHLAADGLNNGSEPVSCFDRIVLQVLFFHFAGAGLVPIIRALFRGGMHPALPLVHYTRRKCKHMSNPHRQRPLRGRQGPGKTHSPVCFG